MNVKPIIGFEEVKRNIVLPNPGGRKIVIKPEESGWKKEQVFTSDDLPDEIPYKLLGFVKFPDGNIHPKYVASVTTTKELILCERKGVINGVEIIDKVANWLIYQEDVMITAQSIKRSDLRCFEYRSKN